VTELPPLPLRIGFDRARIVRSALVMLAVATVGAVVLVLFQRARPTALGEWLGARNLGPVPLLFVVVESVALLVAGVAVASAWQQRDFIVLRADGIEFHNYHGVFLVEWENLARLERTTAGYVGLQLCDPARLIATHQGTAEQRDRLATLEPVSGYELILHPEQLPCGVDRFVAWVQALRYSKNSVCRSGEE
jgi:hypothetical protein